MTTTDSHLIGCLLLYQHRQDQALGITWYSKRVRSLLWYYLYLQHREYTTLLQAAYLNSLVQKGTHQIKLLVMEAETADSERKRTILKEVEILNLAIDKAQEQYQSIITGVYG